MAQCLFGLLYTFFIFKTCVMKANRFVVFGLLLAGLLVSAFAIPTNSVIRGKVIPPENALHVFAIIGTDTIKNTIVQGSFELNKLKAGTYQLWIEATEPYQHKLLTDIVVKEGEITDLGEIQLLVK